MRLKHLGVLRLESCFILIPGYQIAVEFGLGRPELQFETTKGIRHCLSAKYNSTGL